MALPANLNSMSICDMIAWIQTKIKVLENGVEDAQIVIGDLKDILAYLQKQQNCPGV